MRYEAPETFAQAAALLSGSTGLVKILAGGTDLLVQMKNEIIEPDLIIDIKRIRDACTIEETTDGFVIGAAATGAELKEHARLKTVWPGLVEAANLIGSTQVQGRCTLGGNLCNGSPAADSVPALIAAGAVAVIIGPKGTREVPVEDIMIGPRKLSLTKGEIIAKFRLPRRPKLSGDAYVRFIPRTEMDIAVVGCGVSVTLDAAGICTAARVALGAVAARPLLVVEAAKALIGTKLDAGALERAADMARAAVSPIDDKRGTKVFRTKIAGVLTVRTVEIARHRAQSFGGDRV